MVLAKGNLDFRTRSFCYEVILDNIYMKAQKIQLGLSNIGIQVGTPN